ncbi:hypothetical protein RHSIM_Rhsim05G0215800 [Rhododendron simsii]|uniref:Thaumatin-like protein n=1 Tax=Rhododendron simsii TaxID=118357 RepID=A0A834H040_RHOSS|nr:hypothetical protein RHSIM_Rhsim05G0215800 [Rhododendron simsii]
MAIKHGVSPPCFTCYFLPRIRGIGTRNNVHPQKPLQRHNLARHISRKQWRRPWRWRLLIGPRSIKPVPSPCWLVGPVLGSNRLQFDGSGNGKCNTGDCGNKLNCTGSGGVPPVTLAEFTIGSRDNHFMDFYDVSLVDGYNVGIGIRPSNGNGDCKYAGCVADLNANCPPELEVTSAGSGVACKSACTAFNRPEYCCTGDHATPAICPPTQYSRLFKQACPDAYSYAYDDETSTLLVPWRII